MASRWSFILTGSNFVPLGEIPNIQERNVNLPLNKLDTCSFRVLSSNRFAEELLSTACYIKGYRDGVLRYFGPVVTAEEVADGRQTTISITSASQAWVLGKRWVVDDTFATVFDRSWRFEMLLLFNQEPEYTIPGGTTHAQHYIRIDDDNTAAGTAVYTVTDPKLLTTTLSELSSGEGGFDWRFLPYENWIDGEVFWTGISVGAETMDTTYLATFYARPVIGEVKENVIFEYGTGKHNVTGYTRVVSREGQANVVRHTDATLTPETVMTEDGESISNWLVLEDYVQADLRDTDLRQSLTDAHVSVRKNPRQVFDFTPVAGFDNSRVPQFGTDFDVGDIVRARVKNRFDVLARVWGVTFDIDANGVERMTLQLEDQS